MPVDNLKNIAYLTLSDARMIGAKTVNPYRLASHLRIDYTSRLFNPSSPTRGAIQHLSTGMNIVVSDRLPALERNFEMATLLSACILTDYTHLFEVNMEVRHEQERWEDEPLPWVRDAQTLAGMLLAYKFTPREMSIIEHSNSDKKFSKLAARKGLPTKFLLRRIGEELNGTSYYFDHAKGVVVKSLD